MKTSTFYIIIMSTIILLSAWFSLSSEEHLRSRETKACKAIPVQNLIDGNVEDYIIHKVCTTSFTNNPSVMMDDETMKKEIDTCRKK